MIIKTKLNIDMQRNVQRHVVSVVQNDANTRSVEFRLFSDCERWIVPDGVTAALSYSKPDGTYGIYDKLPDGADAFTITGEAVTVILAPQMLTVPGEVRAALVLTESNSDQLSTFPFVVNVAESPNPGKIVSENYCYYTNLDAINEAINELKQAVAGNGGGNGGDSGSNSSQNANKALTFTGAVSATYDGTKEVTVNIPTGGSGGGLTDTEKSHLLTILDAVIVETTKQPVVAEALAALKQLWSGGEVYVSQIGTTLALENVTAVTSITQTGAMLALA